MAHLHFSHFFAIFSILHCIGCPNEVSGAKYGFSVPTEKCVALTLLRSLEFKCKVPQPRAIVSSQIVDELVGETEYIIPSMAVLHRCDSSSGCCVQSENLSCSPAEQEMVRLDFKVWPKFSYQEKIVTILAMNHTACKCMEKEETVDQRIGLRAFTYPTKNIENNNI